MHLDRCLDCVLHKGGLEDVFVKLSIMKVHISFGCDFWIFLIRTKKRPTPISKARKVSSFTGFGSEEDPGKLQDKWVVLNIGFLLDSGCLALSSS